LDERFVSVAQYREGSMLGTVVLAIGALLVQDSVSLGAPFQLAVGSSARIEDTDLTLRFSEVTGDNRCPKDVNCIVAGEAVVVFEAASGPERARLTFEIPPSGGDDADFAGFRVAITELAPEPESGRPLDPSEYVATVLVVKIPAL
jgi:hypothetical protein